MTAQAAIALAAIGITLLIAEVIHSFLYPRVQLSLLVNGEAAQLEKRKSYLAHLMDCGLLYPAVTIYVWVGLDHILS